jgi:hypothetical protein
MQIKERRIWAIEWAKNHLKQIEITTRINLDSDEYKTIRITTNSIIKSLTNPFNQTETHLDFIYEWENAVANAVYVVGELPQHKEQTNVVQYHRLRYFHWATGHSYDIVARELIGKKMWELYFIHPTKPKN